MHNRSENFGYQPQKREFDVDFKAVKKKVIYFLLALFLFGFGWKLLGKNNFGNYQVIQSITGNISVKNDYGYYFQALADVTTYRMSDIVFFSKSKVDGGDSELAAPVEVRFTDGSTGLVSGILKYRMPTDVKLQKLIHRDFGGNERGVKNLVRQTALEALIQTASLIKAEDAYSTRRSEFKSIAHTQIKRGILKTKSIEVKSTDAQGRVSIDKIAQLVLDENGNFIVETPSALSAYGIEIIDFKVKDIDFDDKVDELIAKKKEAEQAKVVAKAQAEEAKQNAITAKEKGAANIARAKAEQEVAKITAVTKAEKEKAVAKLNAEREKEVFELNARRDYEVAKLDKLAAEENAKAMLIKKEAEAKANTLLVKAGLTPLQKAKIDMNTRIGVAEHMSKLQLPKTFIAGSGGKGGAVNPFDAVGLESFMRINEKLAGQATTQTR